MKKKQQICLLKKEYLSDDRCERADMAAKYKIFFTVTQHTMGISIVFRYTRFIKL